MISVLDLEDYMDMDWFKQAHIENLSIVFTDSDFNIIYEDSAVLSGLSAYKIVFTFTQDLYTWRQLEIWTIKDNTLYLLVHQADQAYYGTFTDIIDQMIESFKIIDNSEQDDGVSGNDFDKLIGSWGDGVGGSASSITFSSGGTFSSVEFEENTGTFTIANEKLILNYSTAGINEFEYLFSNNGNTLTLTNLGSSANMETTVLTKQE